MKNDNRFVNISAIWYERFLECSRTYGTSEFKNSVWRFYHSLLNLSDELRIYDDVTEYIEEVWTPALQDIIKKNTSSFADDSSIEYEIELIEQIHIVDVFHFIIQTIQNSNIGWSTQNDVIQYNIRQD